MNSFGVRTFEHRANNSSTFSALLAVTLKGGYDNIPRSQWPQCGRAQSVVLMFISALKYNNIKGNKNFATCSNERDHCCLSAKAGLLNQATHLPITLQTSRQHTTSFPGRVSSVSLIKYSKKMGWSVTCIHRTVYTIEER